MAVGGLAQHGRGKQFAREIVGEEGADETGCQMRRMLGPQGQERQDDTVCESDAKTDRDGSARRGRQDEGRTGSVARTGMHTYTKRDGPSPEGGKVKQRVG